MVPAARTQGCASHDLTQGEVLGSPVRELRPLGSEGAGGREPAGYLPWRHKLVMPVQRGHSVERPSPWERCYG